MVLAQGLGEQGAPHPNDTRENRFKNRSVVVKVRSRTPE
jgi:outer membrane protein OmpA-like peptidoglycan-associated protein